MARIRTRIIALICLLPLVFYLGCTKLTYDSQSAGEAAMATVRDYVNSECSLPLDLSILSIDEEEVAALAPNSRFFHVAIEVREKTKVVGEVSVFVRNNIRIFGFPITNNEIAGTTLMC